MVVNLSKTMCYVTTGEVHTGDRNTILNSGAIGSCVVVVAYDQRINTGAMAHIMLPGDPYTDEPQNRFKYASSAIQELLEQLQEKGAKKENIKICYLGGANVLKRVNDTIGSANIESVKDKLARYNVPVCAQSVGGIERRTALFDVESGCVYYTVGDSKIELLFNFKNPF